MKLFKNTDKYKKLLGLLAMILIIGFLFINNLSETYHSYASKKLTFERFVELSESDVSENCGEYKWKFFCPEYCNWDRSNPGQKCGIDLLAYKAGRSGYSDYLAYLLQKGSIAFDEVLENETEKNIIEVAKKAPESVGSIKDESVLISLVQNDNSLIKYIKNPSETLQEIARKKNGCAIQYVSNPSEAFLKESLKGCPSALLYIKNPSEEIIKLAIKTNPSAIEYVDNPTEEIIKLAIKTNPSAIEYVDNPSDELMEYALQHGYISGEMEEALRENDRAYENMLRELAPSLEENQLILATQGGVAWHEINPDDTSDLDRISFALKRDISNYNLAAQKCPKCKVELDKLKERIERVINEPESVLDELEKPYDRLKILELIFINPYVIKYIDEPTEEMQTLATYLDRNVYQYIKNPSEVIKVFEHPFSNDYCKENFPIDTESADHDKWIDMFVDFSGNMPKEEAIKIIKDNGMRIHDNGNGYGDGSWQIFGQVRKGLANYLQCTLGDISPQTRNLQPLSG